MEGLGLGISRSPRFRWPRTALGCTAKGSLSPPSVAGWEPVSSLSRRDSLRAEPNDKSVRAKAPDVCRDQTLADAALRRLGG